MAASSPLCPPPPLPIPPPPRPPLTLRLVFDCMVAGLLTFLSTLLALALRRLLRRPAPASAVALFHPYTSDGDGGERVLWCTVRAVQEICPGLPRAVFTGNADASPPAQSADSVSVAYACRRHHGWGRINSFTKEAVAKIVDDTYRSLCFHYQENANPVNS